MKSSFGDAKAGHLVPLKTFWNPATISARCQSRDKDFRKNPERLLEYGRRRFPGVYNRAIFTKDRYVFLCIFSFSLRNTLLEMATLTNQSWESFVSRDTIVVVNSVDLFYAKCKLLPLLSLSHEQRSSEIPVVHGGMALRFNDMCEICNILRNSWYISHVTPAGSWSAPAVDTSAIYRRR